MSDYDAEMLKHIPRELHDEYARTIQKPQQRPKPDLDPTPLAEREDRRTQVAPGIYREEHVPSAEDYAEALRTAHQAWEWAGQPSEGPAADAVVAALADAYMTAPIGSEMETQIGEYGVAMGLEDVIAEAADEFNRAVNRATNAERGMEVVDALWSKDPVVAQKLTEVYSDPRTVEAIARGDFSLDEIREHLGENRAAIEEATLADRRYAEETLLDEELVRASALDERTEERYREELARATIDDTTVSAQDVLARKQRLLGDDMKAREAAEMEAAELEELKRMGAIVDPADDERRQRWFRESEEARRTEAADRAEGRW